MVDLEMFKQDKDDLARLIQTFRQKGLPLEEEEKNVSSDTMTEAPHRTSYKIRLKRK
jgi:hypothetical protein